MGLPSAAGEGLRSAPGSGRPAGLYGYWIYYNRDGSVSFGTETREYFGSLPAEIVCAVPESVINCIACTIFEAHRTGRREAYTYLKEFVLEKLEVPDWPLDPVPRLPRMTPPPLPPESS
jgi:hypothetical protein